jgi:hypothetical protein
MFPIVDLSTVVNTPFLALEFAEGKRSTLVHPSLVRRLYREREHTGRRREPELITVGGYTHADQSFQTEEVYRASAA